MKPPLRWGKWVLLEESPRQRPVVAHFSLPWVPWWLRAYCGTLEQPPGLEIVDSVTTYGAYEEPVR